jgi:recombinational DNA repair protein (RecF pathway)
MLEIKLCTNCKRSLSKKDIDSGYAVYQEGGRLICKECSSLKIKKEKGYEEKDFILESLLNEVKNINRTLTYETVSWLNIIAAVVQCFVFGSLIFAYLNRNGEVHAYLLLALVFQVMALTFFVIKK